MYASPKPETKAVEMIVHISIFDFFFEVCSVSFFSPLRSVS